MLTLSLMLILSLMLNLEPDFSRTGRGGEVTMLTSRTARDIPGQGLETGGWELWLVECRENEKAVSPDRR